MMRLVVNGRDAAAYCGGVPFDAARPAVVLLHGALNDHSVWSLTGRYLAHHGWAVLALDQPGHGQSAGPALASVEALADWVVASLDAAGVRSAALVGHSLGSLIVLEAAARLGERATALVLVATAFPMNVPAELLRLAEEAPLQLEYIGQRRQEQEAAEERQEQRRADELAVHCIQAVRAAPIRRRTSSITSALA